MPLTKVDSFELDHTKVRAPYVRLAGCYKGPNGDQISKYDLRLVQPNQQEIPTAALHTIEHLLAGYLRDALEQTIIDASPMGCRTGFYMTVLGEPQEALVQTALVQALRDISKHEGEIPGCSALRCGNFRDHSLPGARAWATEILTSPIIIQETVPILSD